ncbi:hybrid sensor histidine kinase/response regulator [Draconibacterium mangrovi]|uniref:hybrid sensor histidine kinase/response regulator n=1 Tax=Draconibacterium mangrovi TaxID=2697469 RepID=UPI0013D03049|nr:ATP-binding protein [Draconibacterium mangrovi]
MKDKLITKPFLLFCFVVILFVVISPQLVFSTERGKYIYFTDIDGLPRNLVTCIEQDKYGYLWVGTGNGVARYNGSVFRNYEQLNGQIIRKLIIDPDNNLWLSSDQGLYSYNRLKDRFEIKYEGFIESLSNFKNAIYFASQNKVWKVEPDGLIELISGTYIREFVVTEKGIWYTNGYDGIKFQSGNSGKGIEKNYLEGKLVPLIREIDGILFFGCHNGQLFVINEDNKETEIKISNHHSILEIEKVDDEFWLATDGSGIIILDEKLNYIRSIKHGYPKNSKLQSNSIYDIYLGQDNEVWIATYGAGLVCILDDTSPFKNIIPEPGNRNSLVAKEGVSVFKKGNRIFLGTNYGLSILEENTGAFSNLFMNRIKKDLKGSKVTALHSHEENNFWIGTYDGLLGKYTSDLKLIRSYKPCGEDGTNMQRIVSLHQCEGDNLLIGTHYTDKNLLNFNLKSEKVTPITLTIDGQPRKNLEPTSLRENQEGETLALLRAYGLYTVNLEKGILENNFPEINNRITFKLNDFYHDRNGYYWLATQTQGLIRMSENGREFDKWTSEQGLPTNTLLRIECTDNKYLWISTIAGLCRFEMETGEILIFNHEHGLSANEFSARASVITDEGKIIFASNAGFTFVDPEKVKPDTSQTQVIISDITFHNQSIKQIDDIPVLNRPLEETGEIHLPYNRNSFTIHFFSKDKNLPKYNNYRYRLQGLEEDWIYLGETKHTTYTNLSPGKYTFQVKCTNKSNVWSEIPTQLIIQINPPWYLSWYAIVGYVIGVIAIVFGSMYAYTNRLKLKKEVEMSEFKVNAERQLTEKKLVFFTNVSHDLKTPLTLIDAPVNELLRSENIRSSEKEKLLIIKRNAKRLYKLITDLLDFRKLSNNQLPLKVGETNINLLIENIYQAFEKEFKNKAIHFERNSTVQNNVYIDSKKIEQILWNLLSNASKYTTADGKVFLSAEEEKVDNHIYLKLSVKDTGVGIPDAEHEKIFNRFYQYDKHEGSEIKGTGIGLSIVKDLVELHRGTIALNSKEGVGTTFTVSIPAEKHLFVESEIEKAETSLPFKREDDTENTYDFEKNKHNRYNLPKVLLVEDNQELREYLVDFFDKNFKVYSADDGQQGLKLAKEKLPDIIISDILMPNMNGYELCNEIRNNFDTSHIPVVMLTSNSTTEQQIKGLTTGADAYITKPFSIDLLETSVLAILKNRKKLRNRFLGVEQSNGNENKISKRDIEFIDALKLFLDDNLSNQNLNVETIARHFSISRTQLNRKIKSLTGQTPNSLIKSIRLKKAFELIKNEGLMVSEASYMVGFTDPNYFTICFSKEFGKNPSKIDRN